MLAAVSEGWDILSDPKSKIFPVFSLMIREFHAESSLHQTASSATQSFTFRDSPLSPYRSAFLRPNYLSRFGSQITPKPLSRCTKTLPFLPIRTHSRSGRENSVVHIGLSMAGHL
jgi:hypothetical protein